MGFDLRKLLIKQNYVSISPSHGVNETAGIPNLPEIVTPSPPQKLENKMFLTSF